RAGADQRQHHRARQGEGRGEEQDPQGLVGGGEEAPGGQAQGRERGEEEVFVRPQQGEEEVRRRDEEGEDSGPEGLGQVFLRLRQAIGGVDQDRKSTRLNYNNA